jgi:hypothetical protein
MYEYRKTRSYLSSYSQSSWGVTEDMDSSLFGLDPAMAAVMVQNDTLTT